MRKRLRKFLSLALALTLCASLCVPALAADTPADGNTVTVTSMENFTARDEYDRVALENGKTYKLGADISLTKDVYIPDGAAATLDLNGNTLTIGDGTFIGDKGALTVQDSGTTKSGKFISYAKYGTSCTVGSVTINGGTFQKIDFYTCEGGNSQITINNGIFTDFAISSYAQIPVAINGGTFTNKVYLQVWETNGQPSNITIAGGTFQGPVYIDANVLAITGGTFSDNIEWGYFGVQQPKVTGGTFKGGTDTLLLHNAIPGGYIMTRNDDDFTVSANSSAVVPAVPAMGKPVVNENKETLVTLTSDADAKLYYRFDTASKLEYVTPWALKDYAECESGQSVKVTEGGFLLAYVVKNAVVSGGLLQERVDPLWPPIPTASPEPGTYAGSVKVELTVEEQDAEIYYLVYTDDMQGYPEPQKYTGPITLIKSSAVKAYTVIGEEEGKWITLQYVITPAASGGSSSSGDDDDGGGAASVHGTTTVTDKTTGTVTETTTERNGTKKVVVTKKNGDKTTTITQKNGTKTTLRENVGEPMEATVALSSVRTGGQRITVPVTVDTNLAEVTFTGVAKPIKAVVPVEGVSNGTVAVIDGVISKTAIPENGNLIVPLGGNATVVIRDNTKTFNDIPGSFWANGAVAFVTSRELFNGTSGGVFTPDAAMSRQMLMTVLARLDGVDTSASPYAQGLAWAKAKGISDGSNPTANISREQLAVMLYRYAGLPAVSGSTLGNRFGDAGSVGEYARAAMEWAVQNGIVTGKTGGVLDPKGQATRAQVAVMLQRYIVSIA